MSPRTYRTRAAGTAALLTLAAISAARADVTTTTGSITIAGSTAFAAFFESPGSTNDFIDVNNDGIFGFNPNGGSGSTDPAFVQQLAPPIQVSGTAPNQTLTGYTTTVGTSTPNLNGASIAGQWSLQYIGAGSVNGLTDFVQSQLTNGATLPASFSNPSSLNGTPYTTQQPGHGIAGFPANTPITKVDAAVVDVALPWAVQGAAGTPAWNAKPATPGYGANAQLPANATVLTNDLPTLSFNGGSLNLNTTAPNSSTIFGTSIAFAPVSFVANHGTGLQNITQSDLAFLYVTGRAPDGTNYVVATRDIGSGTRAGAMNSLGVDPSFGVGDNIGNQTIPNSTQSLVGSAFQPTNLDATGTVTNVVRDSRLAVGYVSTSTGKANEANGSNEVLGIQFTGGTGFVRPTAESIINNDGTAFLVNGSDVNFGTGYRIGGVETIGTVGDPLNATTSAFSSPVPGHASNPSMANTQAALYVRNIYQSINAFQNAPNSNASTFMPAQSLITVGIPLGATRFVQNPSDPTQWISNPNFVTQVYNAEIGSSGASLNTGAYGSGVAGGVPAPFGIVPTRQTLSGSTYSDGQAGTYRFYDSAGTLQSIPFGAPLNSQMAIVGDFNDDGARNVNDIPELMNAISNTTQWAMSHNSGTTGSSLGTAVIPELMGDFNSDGNFDSKDVRYFADGLAIATSGPNAGHLDRDAGFTAVDNNWTVSTAGHPAGNYFNTTLITGKPYQAGDSRGDVVGSSAGLSVGASPTGPNGVVDVADIEYVALQAHEAMGNGTDGTFSTLLTRAISDPTINVHADLSADMNGDGKIDAADVADLVQNILGTRFGDSTGFQGVPDGNVDTQDLNDVVAHWQQTGATWATGDTFGPQSVPDGKVDIQDLNAVVANWQFNASAGLASQALGLGTSAAVPEPASLSLLALGAAALLTRRRKNNRAVTAS